MKEQKLISMVDFVLWACGWHDPKTEVRGDYDRVQTILNYANFLKQPLTTGMFVPTDLEGNVLEEPRSYIAFINGKYVPQTLLGDCLEYQQAKERVLFEGVEHDREDDYFLNSKEIQIDYKNDWLLLDNDYFEHNARVVKDLIRYGLTLTPTACKQIGWE